VYKTGKLTRAPTLKAFRMKPCWERGFDDCFVPPVFSLMVCFSVS
jgi:hypothetical protein